MKVDWYYWYYSNSRHEERRIPVGFLLLSHMAYYSMRVISVTGNDTKFSCSLIPVPDIIQGCPPNIYLWLVLLQIVSSATEL